MRKHSRSHTALLVVLVVAACVLGQLAAVAPAIAGAGSDQAAGAAVEQTAASAATRVTRDWTYMVYLDGDNNLEAAAIDDFLEMSSVGSTPEVAVVAQMDRIAGYDTSNGDWTDTRRFYVTHDMTPTAGDQHRRGQHGRPGHPGRLRPVGHGHLPGRPLRPDSVGPRERVAEPRPRRPPDPRHRLRRHQRRRRHRHAGTAQRPEHPDRRRGQSPRPHRHGRLPDGDDRSGQPVAALRRRAGDLPGDRAQRRRAAGRHPRRPGGQPHHDHRGAGPSSTSTSTTPPTATTEPSRRRTSAPTTPRSTPR